MVKSLLKKVIRHLTSRGKSETPAPKTSPAPVAPPPRPSAAEEKPTYRPPAPAPTAVERPPSRTEEDTRPPRHRGGRGRGRGDRPPHSREPDRPAAGADAPPQARVADVPTHTTPVAPWDPATGAVPAVEGKTRFADLDLTNELLHAIADLKFQYCTPIQAAVLPHTLKSKDAFGKAQTGTGKTAAFLLTIFNHMSRRPLTERQAGTPRALILAPTRELVMQIQKDAVALARHMDAKIVAVFGGMDYDKQRRQLQGPVDVIVATPGRLLDFKQKQELQLSKVEILVIDEADRMLDMGFIPDVREIVHSTPNKSRRQTMLFSATLTPEVQRLAAQWTTNPISVEIEPEQVAVDTVDQRVYIVTMREKFALLYNILERENAQRAIVFANRRDEAERLMEALLRYRINCALLSGAVPQEKRMRTLEDFRNGKIRALVATDVAGRGIHVDAVSHVINFNLPMDPEDYVHRIGRTGRAGAQGMSISFACEDDSFQIPELEKYLGRALKCIHPEDEWLKLPPPPPGYHARRERPQEAPRSDRRDGGRGRRPPGRREERPRNEHPSPAPSTPTPARDPSRVDVSN